MYLKISHQNINNIETEKKKIPKVRFLDIGCGFGGLLISLGKLYKGKLGIGMEIRSKACDIVKKKIENNGLNNISVIHTNVMKYITNYFDKNSIDAMYFCFPDPHFKKSNIRRRIISVMLLDYYAYLLNDNGIIYNITDVKELYEWTLDQFKQHPLFIKLTDNDIKNNDIIRKSVDLISNHTDEAKRVTKNGGNKYVCVYRKIKI